MGALDTCFLETARALLTYVHFDRTVRVRAENDGYFQEYNVSSADLFFGAFHITSFFAVKNKGLPYHILARRSKAAGFMPRHSDLAVTAYQAPNPN